MTKWSLWVPIISIGAIICAVAYDQHQLDQCAAAHGIPMTPAARWSNRTTIKCYDGRTMREIGK